MKGGYLKVYIHVLVDHKSMKVFDIWLAIVIDIDIQLDLEMEEIIMCKRKLNID